MSLEENLVILRKQKGLTQMELAEKLNVSRQAVSRWEVGAAVPSMENLQALAMFYAVSVDALLDNTSKANKEPKETVSVTCSFDDMTNTSKEPEEKGNPEYPDENPSFSGKPKRRYILATATVCVLLMIAAFALGNQFGKSNESEGATPISDLPTDKEEYPTETFSFDW